MKPVLRHPQAAASFYHLQSSSLHHAGCQGLACFVARKRNTKCWPAALAQEPRVYCLGKCYGAPSNTDDAVRPLMASYASETVLLGNLLRGGVRELDEYRAQGGYLALHQALWQPADELVKQVEQSGLRGRGGAGFPAGKKWASVRAAQAGKKFVVANADEGDAGAFSDRFLLEDDPFRLIEAMTIAGFAVGAQRGYIYLRKEYPLALPILQSAIQAARSANFLGEKILGSGFDFEIEIVIGQGSYVCGEETALLNSIEKRRPEVRMRPPWICAQGLFGAPTLMHNVETLAAVPWIVTHGGKAYQQLGFSRSRGTKLVSLNSLFRRPGLYEVEFGISLRKIVEDIGGGLAQGKLKGVIVGGPLAGIVPPQLLDTPFGYEELHAIGAEVGHGGIIAFDEQTSIAELMEQVFRFGAFESCGKCTPCHFGSPVVANMFAALNRGEKPDKTDDARWRDIIESLAQTSFCGHGRGLAAFAQSAARYYSEELAACFR
ncbi:MAG: formate dehydrogenase iron-sulfur subunit [Pseudomonadota bacterium]|nr:formate dehydrogenase iron-sulfur subunit [Pseudomonadota bacterium]